MITVIIASAAVTLLEQRPGKKISGSERDSNPRPLRCRCSALPTELSKPHESGRIRVSPLYGDALTWPKYCKDECLFVCMFYTLIKHGFLTNQSARRVLSILLFNK